MAKHRIGDVIVLLPGILGSVLTKDGKEVWAPTPGAAWRAVWSLGAASRTFNSTATRWTRMTWATASRPPG